MSLSKEDLSKFENLIDSFSINKIKELDKNGQRIRQIILDNPDGYKPKLVKSIFFSPKDPYELFIEYVDRFNCEQIDIILKISSKINLEITKAICDKYEVSFSEDYFFTDNLECLKILIETFKEEFAEFLYIVLHHNLKLERFDITDYIFSNFEVSPKLLKTAMRYRPKDSIWEYVLKHIPTIFNYYGDRELTCSSEIANILSSMGFGKKINLINLTGDREFLRTCRFDIYLKDYIDNFELYSVDSFKFFILLEACEDYVYDYELLKVFIHRGVEIFVIPFLREDTKKYLVPLRAILKSLSKRYPKDLRKSIKSPNIIYRVIT